MMNARPTDRFPSPASRRIRSRSRRKRPWSSPVETGFKLGVNVMLAAVAISTLIKLVPYSFAQQNDLQALQAEVVALRGRVDRLQANLNYLFDPNKAIHVMQTGSDRLTLNQRLVIWRSPPVN